MRRSTLALLALGTITALLAGCASNPAPVEDRSFGGTTASPSAPAASVAANARGEHAHGTLIANGYRVAAGDTLYSIAFRNGLDFRTLAARNDIAPPYTIHPGQVLRLDAGPQAATLNAPVASTSAPKPAMPVFENVPAVPSPAAASKPLRAAAPAANAQQAPVFEPVPASSAATIPAAATSSASAVATAPTHGATMPATASTGASGVAARVAPPAPTQASTAPRIVPGASRTVDGIAWQWPVDGAVIDGVQSGGGNSAGLDIAGNAGDPVRAAADGTVVYSGNGLIGYGELIIIKHNDTYLSAYGHNRKRLVQEGERVRAGQVIAEMGSSGAPREELHFEIRRNGKPVDPAAYLPGR